MMQGRLSESNKGADNAKEKILHPIGILIVAICAIGFLSLRSDVPEKPIQIYKTSLSARGRFGEMFLK